MSLTASDSSEKAAITRALQSLAAPGGGISTLALDHRDAMRNAYRQAGVEGVDEARMIAAKVRIAEVLTARCSSILLDAGALAHCRPPGLAVLMPLEEQGHDALEGGRLNRLLEDFFPAAADLDIQGCKLLLYYRADHPPTASRQLELVAAAAADCHRHGLPLVVEPKAYPLADERDEDFVTSFGELVVAGARDLAESGADLLKVQYPGNARACERISAAVEPVPWTLLGGSEIDGETFAAQLRTACNAGASGFIAGRAIWGGALALAEREQRAWLTKNALPTLERLVEITDTHARRLT